MKISFLSLLSFSLLIASCNHNDQPNNEKIKQQISALWQRGMARPQDRPDSITILHVERVTEKELLGKYVSLLENEIELSKKSLNEPVDTLYKREKFTRADSINEAETAKDINALQKAITIEMHRADSIKQVCTKANGTDIYGCIVHVIIYTTENNKQTANDETIFIANDERMYFVDIYTLLLHKLKPFKMD